MRKIRPSRRTVIAALLALAAAGTLQAQGRYGHRMAYDRAPIQRFALVIGGGGSALERDLGLIQLKAELQFAITRSLRIGLGVGYLDGRALERGRDCDRREADGSLGNPPRDTLSGGWTRGEEDKARETLVQDMRAVPFSLNLTYFLPVGRRLEMYVGGGANYLLGSFRGDAGRQHQWIWGGQGILGIACRVTNRIQFIAEGGYRFAEFKNVRVPKGDGAWIQNLGASIYPPPDLAKVDVDISGFNGLLGVKVGF